MSSTPYADPDVLGRSRREAVRRCDELGRPDLADDAALVMGELVTNALLHGGGCTGVSLHATAEGVRIEVRDASRLPPMLGRPTEGSLTGRGLRLVDSVSVRWGADAEPAGKVVWAEVTGEPGTTMNDVVEADILAMWDDDTLDIAGERRYRIELGEVPTDLLMSAKSHVDNLVREFTLASAGALTGQTAEVPEHLRTLLGAVVDRFAEARLAIKRQALAAAGTGSPTTRLVLDLPASAADAAEAYVSALDEIDAYCRARRLLTLETAEQHRTFRRWYVEELVRSLRAAAAGEPLPKTQTFERRLLSELDRVAEARRLAERSARLYSVAAALATAATPESVAHAVLDEGIAALGAAAGTVLLSADDDRLVLWGAVGYDETVLARLRGLSRDAELPAAVALRTGQPVWLESPAERDERFPELVEMEPSTVALCAVPLEVQGRQGALRFSFTTPRLFDEDERRFVRALADQTAQALERTQLQRARVDVSRRLQRSLLPPSVPDIDGLEVAAIYQPFGDEMDVGGDFYDIWALRPGAWALAIGDAAGTGPEAAALTALVRHTLRALSLTNVDAVGMMRMLNAALLDAALGEEGERFCTALLGLITVSDGVHIQLATGGHPPPMLRRADGTIETVDVRGSLLGVLADTDVWTVERRLLPGDTLVAVTDGVLEARRAGRMFDTEGIAATLSDHPRSARQVADALQRAVLDHVGGSLTDDMAAIVLHVPS